MTLGFASINLIFIHCLSRDFSELWVWNYLYFWRGKLLQIK